jgi:hypothetical protein
VSLSSDISGLIFLLQSINSQTRKSSESSGFYLHVLKHRQKYYLTDHKVEHRKMFTNFVEAQSGQEEYRGQTSARIY